MKPDTLKVIYHDLYLTDYPTASCETPARVVSIAHTLKKFYPVVGPAAASEDDILLVHTSSILNSVKADQDLYRAAAMAADLACQGQPTFAAVRPPGHHASPDSHWGFCFFNRHGHRN